MRSTYLRLPLILWLLGISVSASFLRAQFDRYEGVYFGTFSPVRGTWALVVDAMNAFHFVGFVAERRQLIEGNPYWWDVLTEYEAPANPSRPGHFWDWGPYGFRGTITNGYVSGTAAIRFTPVGNFGFYGPSPYSDVRFSGGSG